MPHYRFNVRDDESHIGFQGMTFPALADARRESFKLFSRLLQEYASEPWVRSAWRIELTDETGLILLTLNFSTTELGSMSG